MRPTTVEEARIIRASTNNSVARALRMSECWYNRYKYCLTPVRDPLLRRMLSWRHPNRAIYYRTKAVVTFDRELV